MQLSQAKESYKISSGDRRMSGWYPVPHFRLYRRSIVRSDFQRHSGASFLFLFFEWTTVAVAPSAVKGGGGVGSFIINKENGDRSGAWIGKWQ